MSSRSKQKTFDASAEGDLWVNPKFSLRGSNGNRAWDYNGNVALNTGTRLLELADIALGLKKTGHKKKKAVRGELHG